MKNYRLGNTITIKWTIMTATGTAYNLNANNLELYAVVPNHAMKVDGFSVAGNVITWTFRGTDQKFTGPYTLTLIENRGQSTMMTVDYCNAFGLVRWSCQAGWDESADVDSNLSLTSEIFTHQIALSKEVQAAIEGNITEYNVSNHYPADGIDGSNRYTLESAIAKIPYSLRNVGIKCSFLNEDGQVETWVLEGGTWNQVSPPKFMGKVETLNDINVLSGSISAGAYTFNANTSNITGLPDGFSGYGWLIVIHSNLRILIGNSHPDRLYIKTSSSDWEDFSKLTISQTTGDSAENLMSQKAITGNLLIVKGNVEDVTLDLELGTYTCSSAAQNLPLDFPDNSFGFLVVLNKNFRLLFLQNKGIAWSKYNDGKWHNMLETAVPAISAGMQIISTLINEAVKNNLFDLETEEISADETTEGAVINRNTGKIQTGVDDNYVVKKYNVNGAKACRIISSTQFQNALFAVFDADDNLLSIKVLADSAAAESEDICITPSNASYVLVGFSTSIREGGLYNFKIVQYKHPGKWSGLKWIVVGDSLTEENVRTTKHYFDYIAEGTGIQVTNMGVSGFRLQTKRR